MDRCFLRPPRYLLLALLAVSAFAWTSADAGVAAVSRGAHTTKRVAEHAAHHAKPRPKHKATKKRVTKTKAKAKAKVCYRGKGRHRRKIKCAKKAKGAGKAAPARPTTSGGTGTGTGTGSGTGGTLSWDGWNILSNPIDPTQQTDLPFGNRSYWLQPWRAYLDTPPASVMRNAVGINFNVPASSAAPAAALLASSGFKVARLEIGWSSMSYSNPGQLSDPASIDAELNALKDNGIRPLILLNANDAGPGPSLRWQATVTAPAAAGATQIQVDAASAAQLVPGLSGLDVPGGPAAAFIATSVSLSGLVTLSQPLPVAVPAGTYAATTLRYQPFAAPFTASGAPNPAFEQTLSGWLAYVQAVTAEAQKVLGDNDFDVEIWNELSFGSAFLSAGNYYNPVPVSLSGTGSVDDQLLARTVQWLRDPANGLSGIGIGDGFADQTPFVSGSNVPDGVTAIDRHPYNADSKQFPQDAANPVYTQSGIRPVNALGSPGGTDSGGTWSDSFTPDFVAFFPEYYLTGLQTEFTERDLSPIDSTYGGVTHGRDQKPAGASAPTQMWITETGIDPTEAPGLTTADQRHLQAKAALRTLSAFVNKGVTQLDFYAALGSPYGMIDVTQPSGGETMTAIQRFASAFAGPATITPRRSLSLLQIADQGNWTQFSGDGTAAYPALANRDVVAFFPFQVSATKFVIPAYVMTRNMAQLYHPGAPASDVTRYDLPPETYRLTVGGIDAAKLTATASDPLTGSSVPVSIVQRSDSTAVLQIPLTDSPRLIVLQDG
jgi:hypothetical protein